MPSEVDHVIARLSADQRRTITNPTPGIDRPSGVDDRVPASKGLNENAKYVEGEGNVPV